MREGIENTGGDPAERKIVFHHLKLADILLVIVPMVLVTGSLVILTLNCRADMLCAGVALGSFILAFLFCALYGGIALVLSLLTHQNVSFRMGLFGSLLAMIGGGALLLG